MNQDIRAKALRCPHCGHGVAMRTLRSFRMKLVPGSRHYICESCNRPYVTALGIRFKM